MVSAKGCQGRAGRRGAAEWAVPRHAQAMDIHPGRTGVGTGRQNDACRRGAAEWAGPRRATFPNARRRRQEHAGRQGATEWAGPRRACALSVVVDPCGVAVGGHKSSGRINLRFDKQAKFKIVF